MATLGEKIGGSLLLGAVGTKLYLMKRFRALGHGKRDGTEPGSSAWNNRRSFARLPRRKQREMIYRKRAQLREFESITYGGGFGLRRRRRRMWG